MSAYSDLMLSTAPVAYWRLGDAAGTTAVDSSGNSHNGTYVNGPILGQPGLIDDPDTAVFFDGADDYVAVAQHADLKLPGAMTAQAWIKPGSLPGPFADIVRQGVTPMQYALAVSADGSLQFRWYDGAYKIVSSSAGVIIAGGVYHVAATRDASLFVRVYVNGVQVASGQGTAPTVDPVVFEIGGSTDRFFNGLIDEVAVHNYALTGPQVAELYDLGVNGPPPPPPPPPPSGGGVTRPARRYHRMGRGVTR